MKKLNTKFLFDKWKLWIFVVVCMTLSSLGNSALAQCDLVVDGTFAAAHACPQTNFTYDYQCDAARPIGGAAVGGYLALTNNARIWNGPWWGTSRLADGTNFLIADGGGAPNTRVWVQTVNVVAGQQYTFSVWVRNLVNPGSGAGNEGVNLPSVNIRVNGVSVAASGPIAQTAVNVWRQVSGVYTATTTGPVSLDVFQNLTGRYNDIGVDDISFTFVPRRPAISDVRICSGTSATLTASGAVAGSTYEWYAAATGGTALFVGNPFVTPALTTATSYWVETVSPTGCRSARTRVRVNLDLAPTAPTASNVNICGPRSATLFANGGSPSRMYWYSSATSTTSIFRGSPFITPVLNTSTSYWVSNINPATGCASPRTRVDVIVTPTPAVPVVSNLAVCQGSSATINATGGPILNWYSSNTSPAILFTGNPFVTPAINANRSYWVSATTPEGCTSARARVNITVNPLPAAPTTTNASRCGCGTLDLTASGSTGTFNWYTTQNGGTPIFNGTNFTTPQLCATTDYWVSAVSAAGCESPRVRSTATITAPVAQPNLVTNGNFAAANSCPQFAFTHPGYTCLLNPPVRSGIVAVTNNAALWNGPWSGTNRLADGTNFLVSDGSAGANPVWQQNVNVVAGMTYTYTVWVRNIVNAASLNEATNPSVSLTVNGVALTNSGPIVQTAAGVWRQVSIAYTAPATGSITLGIVHNVEGTWNDIGVDDISFTGTAPSPEVTDVEICAGNTATLTATGAIAGYTYVWYDAATGGTALSTQNPYVTPVLNAATTYWVALRDANGCESDRVPGQVTIKATPQAPLVTDANRCDCGTLTLTASGSVGTYNWYSAATNGTLLGTGESFTTPSICSTTTYYVSVTDASGCVSLIGSGTASITGAAATIVGPTQVYANGIVNYEITISNNSGADMNNISINASLADFVLDNTVSPNPYPAGPYSILAGGAPIVVTYRGYFPTSGGTPKNICFDIVANGCTTQVCKTITNIYAGCPFAWGAPSSDCDTETYGNNGVIKTISLSGHNNFFDITKIDFNLTYNPTYVAFVSSAVVAGAPAGSTVSTTSTTNTDGTITVNGTVNYGSKIDILTSNGDGDAVVYNIVDLGFRILARPLTTCDLQFPTTGTTFYSASGTLSRPTDYARITFLCAPCPAISAFFTASPNPVLQGATITFTANPTGGAHTWYSGANNNRQLGSTSPTAMYVYNTPGTYTVTHYRTENGLTGIYQQDVVVCGITTDPVDIDPCAGSTINVPFTASACSGFQNNNVFSLELSDASGNFSNNNPNVIGTWAGTTSGNITGVIPVNTLTGSKYRVRVISSSPVLKGTNNGIDMTISNCNSGLVFDGIDDRVTIPNHAAYAVGSGNFTLEILVNIPSGNADELALFSKRTTGSNGFLVYLSGNQLLLQMSGVPNYVTGSFPSIRDGNCHHIAITRSGANITFYVDGSSVGTVSSTRSLNSPGPLHIGYDAVDQSSFNGAINEARFWNVSRTQAELAANATSTVNAASAGLIGLWRFNEVATQTINDASLTANNGFLGSTNAAEGTDPVRSVVACYNGDRHDAQSIDKVYGATDAGWNIEVAPNPFVNETAVSIQGGANGSSSFEVEVYTMQGLLVDRQTLITNEQLVLGNQLHAGMYLLKVTQNGSTQTVKVIKQ